MVNIDLSGNITMNRGDSVSVPIFINVNDKLCPVRYPFYTNDELYLGITEYNQPWEHALIKKVFTFEDVNSRLDVVLKLESKETEFLLPGNYFYEIKLRHLENDVETIYTVVPKRQFIILE